MTDEAAWRELVDRHGQAILRIAYRVLRNVHDAEDVTQQVLLELFSKGTPVKEPIIRRLTTFRAIDGLRRRDRAVRFDDVADTASTECLGAFPGSTESLQEQADDLRLAIARLPERQAQCFWLRYVEEMSNQEIAAALQIKPSAVSTALFKAKRSLRDSIRKTLGQNDE